MLHPLDDLIDAPPDGRQARDFLVTKEHRRFIEFADACRRERYIGVCYGPPGVGKTLSARRYSHWDTIAPWLRVCYAYGVPDPFEDDPEPRPGPDVLAEARSVLWTPTVTVTARQLEQRVPLLCQRFNAIVDHHLEPGSQHVVFADAAWHVELLIVDEADRLKTTALEQLRDIFDRSSFGLILIGMPGLEKRLARYPQLYSRIGFAHNYRPLSSDELRFVLAHHWQRLGLTLSAEDFTDTEAVAAVARITGGNFRLVHRLFAQIQRILEINQLTTVTREVVEAARETLVIGAT
ncbi:MAG: AAA family ATPase [Thermoleophilaceae bacterium]